MKTPKQRMNSSKRTSDEAGFTMVELLVVLAIVALIASLAAPQVLRYLDTARVDTARAQIRNITAALELYYVDTGGYPGSDEGLRALAIAPASVERWNGPYLKGADALLDPWGRAYEYQSSDTAVLVRSLGRDGETGGEGIDADITN
jgi:general secretion pathway protein G